MVKRLPAAYMLFVLLLSVLFDPCDAAAAGQSSRKVLLLTSYHQGDRWNDSVVQGVREALRAIESVSLSIENLDMRRHTNQDHTRMITEYIRTKYQGRPQDLILVSDDPALNFLLTVRNDIFPNTPVVFCGINNFTPKRIQGQHNITGINEALSLEATLELALKLYPNTSRIIAVVSDTEASGRVNLQQYRAAAARMKDRVQFDELLNMTGENAPEILSHLPKDSLVLRLINLLKPEGGYLSIQESIRLLSTHAPVPVFTLWSFDLGDGALGGYVSSGQDQGHTAGNLAIRILGGQEAEQIPVIMTSPNVPMFDYKVMERFGLKESALPKGSVVLNHQMSMWEQYWAWLLGITLFCGLQTFLILTLLTRGKKLHAANAALGESEHFTRSLLETIPVPVFYKGRDGHYQGFNQAFFNFYGKSREELIGKSVFDLTSPELAKVYHAHDRELFENPGTQIYPCKVKTSQGDLRDVIFHKASLTDEHGSVTGLIGAILDVTEQKQTEIALLESERRFKNLHNASFGGIAIHDQGNILDCNQGLSHITGYSYEELIGMNGLLLIALQSRELVMANIAAGHEKPYEAWGLRKNGEVYPLRLEARNIPFQGREMRVVEFRDITERKRAEEALRKSEERFLLAMKASNDGLFDWNLETNEIYYSPAWKKMLGYEDHELPNDFSIWENFTDPGDVKRSWEVQQKLITKQTDRFVVEFKMKHKNGHWVDILSRAEALFDDSGQAVRMVGTHTDITERKRAEEQLRKSEEQFRNLYDDAPVGYFEYDLQGNITRVNHTYMKMLGYTAEEMVGQPCWKFIVDELAREQILAKLEGIRPPAVGLERIYRRRDGAIFPVLFEDRLLLDEDGRIKGIRTAIQDITELKQAEEEREKLQAQLTQAQKMESVGRLAGGVAHDFNNMLGVIFGHTEMALEDADPAAPLYASLQAIQHAAERSAALTRQLLAFARKQTITPKVIDINDAVEGMLNMLRRLIGEDIDLFWRPGANLPRVKVDPAQIDQLLANLCVNARDAIDGVGKITIETDTKTFDEANCADHLGALPGEYLLLEVSDDGSGMDQETLSHIFEPFFTTKEQGKGTGLGLASVFGMVKQNNGFIDVESEPGQGTTFKIYLPVYTPKSDEVVEKATELPVERGHETILLVEDESAILQMTTMMLTRLGYTVVPASTPGEAIRQTLEYRGKIDLLMTDVIMPEMNGRELAGNLLSHYPNLKRLFMSGYTADIIAHHGVLDEGVHFIQKPFSMKDLASKIREALDRK